MIGYNQKYEKLKYLKPSPEKGYFGIYFKNNLLNKF